MTLLHARLFLEGSVFKAGFKVLLGVLFAPNHHFCVRALL